MEQTKLRHRRWVPVALLVVAGCVNYLDRSAVAVGNPQIRTSLGLSYTQMGVLLSAFAWSYGLAQIPAGALVDRYGPSRVLGAGLALWSAAQMAATFVQSLTQFVVARVALGLGESPMYIGGTRVCADWFSLRERALPIAIFNASSALAPALAPPLLTLLMLGFGWRAMFLIAGLAGWLVMLAWVLLYRDPQKAGVRPTEHAEANTSAFDGGFVRILWLLRFRTSWGMFLGFFGVVYITWLYATWLPGYLEEQRHLSVASAGFWSAVPLAAGFVGAIAGGAISQRLARYIPPGEACRLPIVGGLAAAAIFTIAGAFSDSTGASIFFISCGLFGANVASSCGWALAAMNAPNALVATLEAMQNVGGSLGGALAPFATGAVVQATHSFIPALLLAAAIALVSAGIYWWMAKGEITLPQTR